MDLNVVVNVDVDEVGEKPPTTTVATTSTTTATRETLWGGTCPSRVEDQVQVQVQVLVGLVDCREDTMTPEFAAGLREAYCSGFELEVPVTRKVVAAILESGKEHRPDPKARTAFELAHHIVTSEIQMLDEIADGAFSMEEKVKEKPTTVAGLLELYDRELPRALGRVKALAPADLAKVVDFYGALQLPNVAYIQIVTAHSIHHRGQLSTYLRPMGSKVPSIYGGSADEPWQGGA